MLVGIEYNSFLGVFRTYVSFVVHTYIFICIHYVCTDMEPVKSIKVCNAFVVSMYCMGNFFNVDLKSVTLFERFLIFDGRWL